MEVTQMTTNFAYKSVSDVACTTMKMQASQQFVFTVKPTVKFSSGNMVERKITKQKACQAVAPVLQDKLIKRIEYARRSCIVRCNCLMYARRVAAPNLVPTSSLQRHRSKSAPGTSRDLDTVGGRVKNIPRLVNTGKSCGPGTSI